ncbi:MAG TPA: alpha/beta hydrolase [Pyrinomonadaceae bacterium]|jgi:acetyl esterase/lipase
MWIKFGAAALLAALCCAAGAAARQQQQPPRRTMAEIVMTPVVYKVPGMERVSARRDITYKSGDPRLKMDVYTPPGTARGARRPAVLFIHGGVGPGVSPKDWGVFVSWGRLVAASGMVGVTFTHRLGFPKTMLTEGAADVNDAVAYVRANADALGVDGDRLCLAAFSAGGPMLSPAMRDRPPHVRCLVAFYAFMDVGQSEPHRLHETPDVLKDMSPITHLSTDAGRIAPLFVARAGLDAVPTMNDSIDRFVREAVSKNAAVTVYNHPRGVHGFDNQTDDARSREIIRAALEFMKTHLGVGGGN